MEAQRDARSRVSYDSHLPGARAPDAESCACAASLASLLTGQAGGDSQDLGKARILPSARHTRPVWGPRCPSLAGHPDTFDTVNSLLLLGTALPPPTPNSSQLVLPPPWLIVRLGRDAQCQEQGSGMGH